MAEPARDDALTLDNHYESFSGGGNVPALNRKAAQKGRTP
jgi:hypothetical protein